jgi:hypothetical protein
MTDEPVRTIQYPPEAIDAAVRWWAANWGPDETQVKFADALREVLSVPVEPTHANDALILAVDYDPQGLLLEAIRKFQECRGFMFSAEGILPLKTVMRITPAMVEVRAGRRSEWENVWQAATSGPQ